MHLQKGAIVKRLITFLGASDAGIDLVIGARCVVGGRGATLTAAHEIGRVVLGIRIGRPAARVDHTQIKDFGGADDSCPPRR